MPTNKIKSLSEIALLAAFIAISGAFKLPSFIPGSEFQLSAPIAVAICGVFGVKKYILAGLIASGGGLLLGTQTIFNVLIAMIFRVVVAIVFLACGKSKIFYIISGPIASTVARLSLSIFVGKAAYPLVIAAMPGMIFTALTAGFFACALEKTLTASKKLSLRS